MNDERENRSPDLSGIISQISSNPKALAMLSSLLGNMGGSVPHKEADCHDECERSLPAPRSHPHSSFEDRKCLLLALKPFLSPERCQTVDMLLMVLEAFSVFRKGKRD